MSYVLVFLGGGLGSMCRFALARWALTQSRSVLWATLAANVLACGLLAVQVRGDAGLSAQHWRWMLGVGFCGGLSTFSTFSLEAFTLFEDGRAGLALAYVAGSVLLGGAAFALVLRGA